MIIYRNELGQYAIPSMRNRLYINNKRIYGAAKGQVTRKRQKEKRKKKRLRIKRGIARRIKRDPRIVKSKITDKKPSYAVPRELPSNFAWFVENINNVPSGGDRDIFVLVRLGYGAVSESETIETKALENAVDQEWVVPVKIARSYTISQVKKMTELELKEIVERENMVYPVQEVVAVVAKRKKSDIQTNIKNNPLVKEYKEQLKEREKRRKETKRRKWK